MANLQDNMSHLNCMIDLSPTVIPFWRTARHAAAGIRRPGFRWERPSAFGAPYDGAHPGAARPLVPGDKRLREEDAAPDEPPASGARDGDAARAEVGAGRAATGITIRNYPFGREVDHQGLDHPPDEPLFLWLRCPQSS